MRPSSVGTFGAVKAVLCVDVEPDSRTPDPSAVVDWIGAERLFEDHDWLRSQLGGQVINWFLRCDHQVEFLHGDIRWAAERFAGELGALIDAGDEIGVHPHNWRWTDQGWVPDAATTWVVENAERSLEGYTSAFGAGPRSFRYGDRFVSDDVVRVLADHPDVVVDLTAEPGAPACRGLVPSEGATGITRHLDVALAGRYHPDPYAADLFVDSGCLTMVPLTTAVSPDTGGIDTLTLWLPPEEFGRMLRLRLLDNGLDHLAFAIRSDLALFPWAIEHVERNLGALSRTVDKLEWVAASSLALAPCEAGVRGLGLVGSLATTVDEVVRVVDATASVPTVPVVGAVRQAVLQSEEDRASLATASSQLVEAERRLSEVQQALIAERVRVDDLASALVAHEAIADSLSARLEVIESTAIWRLRTVLLPVLRPVARLRRALITRLLTGRRR